MTMKKSFFFYLKCYSESLFITFYVVCEWCSFNREHRKFWPISFFLLLRNLIRTNTVKCYHLTTAEFHATKKHHSKITYHLRNFVFQCPIHICIELIVKRNISLTTLNILEISKIFKVIILNYNYHCIQHQSFNK